MEINEQYWSKVDKTPGVGPFGDCWIWKGMIQKGSRGGYGHFLLDRKIHKAHRISWIIAHGSIPDGLQILHRCDVRPCVNPDHLFLGTNLINVRDKVAKGRHLRGKDASQYSNPKRGEENWNSKFTINDVVEMRKMYASGMTIKEISESKNERRHVVNMIVHGRRWAHVPGSLPTQRNIAKNHTADIIRLKRSGMKQRDIAKLVSLSESAISRIIHQHQHLLGESK